MNHLFGATGFGGGEFMSQGYAPPPGSFKEMYRCYSHAVAPNGKEEHNYVSGVFLPQSALTKLINSSVATPYAFAITHSKTGKTTHANNIEFSAEEGRMYAPRWMRTALGITEEGAIVQISDVQLPTCTFVKFQAQSKEFLNVYDPKAVLENAMTGGRYACLTKGDKIQFVYNDFEHTFDILELKPADAVTTIDADLNVDFAAPVDYEEPEPNLGRPGSAIATSHSSLRDATLAHVAKPSATGWAALTSGGQRLNGKTAATRPGAAPSVVATADPDNAAHAAMALGVDGVPRPLRVPLGQLFFGFDAPPPASKDGAAADGDGGEDKWASLGGGATLRAAKGKGKGRPNK